MTDVIVKDSGERQNFNTGAVRDTNEKKGFYFCLPPNAIFQLARLYEEGAKKYGLKNYLKGIPLSRFLDSALRHTFKTLNGETDENHAIAAAWNMLAFVETKHLIDTGKLPKNLDDIYQV